MREAGEPQGPERTPDTLEEIESGEDTKVSGEVSSTVPGVARRYPLRDRRKK